MGVLTFPEAKPIRGWIRGTGRRGYNIVDGSADLLLYLRKSDSGIAFPRCGAQGWLEAGGLITSEEDLFLNADPKGVSEGLDGEMFVLIEGLDLEYARGRLWVYT
jgi:hypothetical protein